MIDDVNVWIDMLVKVNFVVLFMKGSLLFL